MAEHGGDGTALNGAQFKCCPLLPAENNFYYSPTKPDVGGHEIVVHPIKSNLHFN